MVKDGYRFIVPCLVAGLLCALLHLAYAALLFFALAVFMARFFRNPAREIPGAANLIVSPADGKVVRITAAADGAQTISIFLNIFDVHVNRSPIAGELRSLDYQRGKFKAAFDDEASRVNEQNILTIGSEGAHVVVRQIAGLIARRVVCWKKPGDRLERGELIGLIRFGSRVDVTVPEHARICVRVGDKVRGGSSVIGELT